MVEFLKAYIVFSCLISLFCTVQIIKIQKIKTQKIQDSKRQLKPGEYLIQNPLNRDENSQKIKQRLLQGYYFDDDYLYDFPQQQQIPEDEYDYETLPQDQPVQEKPVQKPQDNKIQAFPKQQIKSIQKQAQQLGQDNTKIQQNLNKTQDKAPQPALNLRQFQPMPFQPLKYFPNPPILPSVPELIKQIVQKPKPEIAFPTLNDSKNSSVNKTIITNTTYVSDNGNVTNKTIITTIDNSYNSGQSKNSSQITNKTNSYNNSGSPKNSSQVRNSSQVQNKTTPPKKPQQKQIKQDSKGTLPILIAVSGGILIGLSSFAIYKYKKSQNIPEMIGKTKFQVKQTEKIGTVKKDRFQVIQIDT